MLLAPAGCREDPQESTIEGYNDREADKRVNRCAAGASDVKGKTPYRHSFHGSSSQKTHDKGLHQNSWSGRRAAKLSLDNEHSQETNAGDKSNSESDADHEHLKGAEPFAGKCFDEEGENDTNDRPPYRKKVGTQSLDLDAICMPPRYL